MSDLLFANATDMWSTGGWESPPVLSGVRLAPSWTWNVIWWEPYSIYAKASVNSVLDLGGGWAFSGIVRYATQNPPSGPQIVSVGINSPSDLWALDNGVTDFIWEASVIGVTFGWGIASASGGFVSSIFAANVNMEIWVTDTSD